MHTWSWLPETFLNSHPQQLSSTHAFCLVYKITNVQICHALPTHSLRLELESDSYPLGFWMYTFHHYIIIGQCALYRVSHVNTNGDSVFSLPLLTSCVITCYSCDWRWTFKSPWIGSREAGVSFHKQAEWLVSTSTNPFTELVSQPDRSLQSV